MHVTYQTGGAISEMCGGALRGGAAGGPGHARRAVAVDGGEEGPGGGVGPGPVDVGVPAPARQLDGVLRRRRPRRVRGGAPAGARGAVGGARPARRGGGRPCRRGDIAGARRQRGAAPAPDAAAPHAVRGRRALHARGRGAAPGVRRLPRAPPHVRRPPPAFPPRARVRQRRAGPALDLGRGGLRCRGGRCRAPRVPRAPRGDVEPRPRAGAAGRARPPRGGDARRRRRRGLRRGARGGGRGVGAMSRLVAASAAAAAFVVESPAAAGLRDTAPSGPIATRWQRRRAELDLVGPVRRRRHRVIVVGAGLAGASAAATLSELGYRVCCLCFHDSPRRAHSVAAQGGINAAKNYQNDGDNVDLLFHDTLEGGDFRSRESNVYRLAELSMRIIDHAVAQGVPFAREYGGHLANRSFGGALVSRTFYARGQTGQQLLLGAYQALAKEEAAGGVEVRPRREMLDLVVVDGRARGVIARDLVSGEIETHLADAVVLATGGYANAYFLSINAKASNATAI